MADKWAISDTHFFHSNIIRYCNRPFETTDEMNETMIANWNKAVKPDDTVIHVGDVAMGYGADESKLDWLLSRLNGRKILVAGNHDHLKSPTLNRYFEKIVESLKWRAQGLMFVHRPTHPSSLEGLLCVHGHIHDKLIDDPRYNNQCVEHTDYAPTPIEELIKRAKAIK